MLSQHDSVHRELAKSAHVQAEAELSPRLADPLSLGSPSAGVLEGVTKSVTSLRRTMSMAEARLAIAFNRTQAGLASAGMTPAPINSIACISFSCDKCSLSIWKVMRETPPSASL